MYICPKCQSNNITFEIVDLWEVNISGDNEFPEMVIDNDVNFVCQECGHAWYDTIEDIEPDE